MTVQPTGNALVFDPDPITLTAVAAVLHSSGFECYCARTAEAAKKALQQSQIDLIVCDLGKEVEKALQDLLRIKQECPNSLQTPVILLIEAALSSLLENAQVTESTYRLSKPFDPRSLMDLARQATWMPHLVSQHRLRGSRPTPNGWVTL